MMESKGKNNRVLSNHVVKVNLTLRIALPALALIGIGISAYLTYIHFNEIEPVCLPGTDCVKVLSSRYAQMWGIPLSLFGLLMYVALTALGFLNLVERIRRQDLIATSIYALALSGTLFSIYLYYLEIFEIHAFCSWCIASSIVMFKLFILSLINLKAGGFNFKEYRHWLRVRVSRYVKW